MHGSIGLLRDLSEQLIIVNRNLALWLGSEAELDLQRSLMVFCEFGTEFSAQKLLWLEELQADRYWVETQSEGIWEFT